MFAQAFILAATMMVETPAAAPAQAPSKAPAITDVAPDPAPAPTPAPIAPQSVASPFELPLLHVALPMAPARVAQVDATALVAKVQSFYNDTKSYSAAFRQTYTNKAFGQKTTKDGKVYIKKPGKMRWDYKGARGPRSSFIADGATAWMVEYDNKQYAQQSLKDSVLPVAITFLSGKGDLTKDFVPSIDTSGRYGTKKDLVLELTPKTSSAQYKKLYLVVDPANYRVKESTVIEGNGNINHFSFYAPNTTRAIADSTFAVNVKTLRQQHFRKINPKK